MDRTGKVFLIILFLFSTSFIPHRGRHYALKLVVIDAGHGGHDSGCLGTKTKEKDVALAVALKLGKYIQDNFKDVEVRYTRKTDVFVELHERAAIANNAKADLFICIHCNSAPAHDVYGTETWVMGLQKSEANLAVAKRENEVVMLEKDYLKKYDGFDPNSPEANIIFSLYQNAYLDQSLKMASLVQQEMKVKGRPGRGVKQAGFLVLYKTSMPSILVETGFLTNKTEEKFLASSKGQEDVAVSIFNAFKAYKNSVENTSSSNDEKENKDSHTQTGGDDDREVGQDTADHQKDSGKTVVASETPVKRIPEVPKKEKSPLKNPVLVTEKKDELIFSVQVASSPKILKKDNPLFRGLKDVKEEKIDGVYKYCSGKFLSLDDAVNYQNKMRTKGFKDAFVVASKSGNRISMKEARELIQKK